MVGKVIKLLYADELRQFGIANEKKRSPKVEQSDESKNDLKSYAFWNFPWPNNFLLFIGKCVIPLLNVFWKRQPLHQQIFAGSEEYHWLAMRNASVLEITEVLCRPLINQKSDSK